MPRNLYSAKEIKEVADCRNYLAEYYNVPTTSESGDWWRFKHPPWRIDSDSGGFTASRTHWKDHAKGTSGTIIDLVALMEFGDKDMTHVMGACEILGEYYGLQPTSTIERSEPKEEPPPVLVATYEYHDEMGEVLYRKLRYRPKDFRQERLINGEWVKGLENCRRVLYNLPAVIASDYVFLCAGEKDADNLIAQDLVATTATDGEGCWRDEYNDTLKGKKVYIMADNDEVGLKHAEKVAARLIQIATEVRVVQLPGLPDKGDISNWLEMGKTVTDLRRCVNDTPVFDPPPSRLEEIAEGDQPPLRNYYTEKVGKKTVRKPRRIQEVIDEVRARCDGFPRKIGEKMFIQETKGGEVQILRDEKTLMAAIKRVIETKGSYVDWDRGRGCMTQSELFAHLEATASSYELILGAPTWPAREDVWHSHPPLPLPSEGHRYFYEFCNFFNPATHEDALRLRMFVASPLYYDYKIERPMWIIDSPDAQGAGKTKLAEMVTMLYGREGSLDTCEPMYIQYEELQKKGNNNASTLNKQILSSGGRYKRVMLIDNVTGYFDSSELAMLVTQGSHSGLAPYGHGTETRHNDLTYVITANSATVSQDLATRSFFINIRAHNNDYENWIDEVKDFISEHRLQVIADIIDILEQGAKFDMKPVTRFAKWEKTIMAPCCDDYEEYSSVWKSNEDYKADANGETDDAQILVEGFKEKLAAINMGVGTRFDPDKDCCFIRSQVFKVWCRDIIPGFGGSTGRNAPQKLRNMAKQNIISNLESSIYKFAGNRGMYWNHHALDTSKESRKFCVLRITASGEVVSNARDNLTDVGG